MLNKEKQSFYFVRKFISLMQILNRNIDRYDILVCCHSAFIFYTRIWKLIEKKSAIAKLQTPYDVCASSSFNVIQSQLSHYLFTIISLAKVYYKNNKTKRC